MGKEWVFAGGIGCGKVMRWCDGKFGGSGGRLDLGGGGMGG